MSATQIGELSRRTGVSIHAIRNCAQMGLLEAKRGSNGYRDFDDSAITRVVRIKRLLHVGLTVDEVRPMAACLSIPVDEEERLCNHLVNLYERKLRALDEEAAALQRKRQELTERIRELRASLAQGGEHGARATTPSKGITSARAIPLGRRGLSVT